MKFLPILCALLALGGICKATASDLDFTLVNKTHRSFEAIYLSPTTSKDWGGNLLANGQVLEAGKKIQVDFDPSTTSPSWDLNIVDSEGLVVTFNAVNLAGKNEITLKNGKVGITAEIE